MSILLSSLSFYVASAFFSFSLFIKHLFFILSCNFKINQFISTDELKRFGVVFFFEIPLKKNYFGKLVQSNKKNIEKLLPQKKFSNPLTKVSTFNFVDKISIVILLIRLWDHQINHHCHMEIFN